MKTNELIPSLQDVDENKGTYSKAMRVASYAGREAGGGRVQVALVAKTVDDPVVLVAGGEVENARVVAGDGREVGVHQIVALLDKLRVGDAEDLVEIGALPNLGGMRRPVSFPRGFRHRLNRRLRNSPAFTAVLTLALGIGATASIFTRAHAIFMKSLAIENPAELYRVGKITRCCAWGGYSQKNGFSIFSYDLYPYFRDNTKGFAELAAFQAGPSLLGVRRSGRAEAAQSSPGEFVSGNYFTMFGLGAYAGRLLTTSDDQAGAPPAAVMSHRLGQERYGLDPSVIGSVFNIDEKPFTVVGITPPAFFSATLCGAHHPISFCLSTPSRSSRAIPT